MNKYSKVAKIFLKKSLEICLGQKSYLTLTFVLVLVEINLLTKNKDGK